MRLIGIAVLVWLGLIICCHSYVAKFSRGFAVSGVEKHLSSALFAHHVNKKITKRMMDRRPKKSRPSDIFRNNVNHDKCITKIEGAPAEYTILAVEDVVAQRERTMRFWQEGDPDTPWIEITAEDEQNTLCSNTEPPPVPTSRQRPPLLRR